MQSDFMTVGYMNSCRAVPSRVRPDRGSRTARSASKYIITSVSPILLKLLDSL
jgi:hypothetical protein